MTIAKAESRMLARAVAHYDGLRSLGSSEASARHAAIAELARLARLDYILAAERLADFLARRAAGRFS